jgi:hypothetical protein
LVKGNLQPPGQFLDSISIATEQLEQAFPATGFDADIHCKNPEKQFQPKIMPESSMCLQSALMAHKGTPAQMVTAPFHSSDIANQ